MRVLFVTAPAQVGGLEAVVQMLSAGLHRAGRDILVLGATDSDESARDFFDGLTEAGVPSARLVGRPRDYRGEQRSIRERILAFRPDVVHTHGYRCDVIGGSAARRARVPAISTAHGYSGEGLRNRFYQWMQERSLRSFDAVAAVSAPILERLAAAGVPRSRLHLVRNAFFRDTAPLTREEARARLGIPHHVFAVGWIGRLEREKGPDILFETAALSGDSGLSFSVIGDGPLETQLRGEASRRGISNVKFHGQVSNAGRLLVAFDALALTSRTEGTPIVLLEAMAAKVPIVAARVGGVADMLSEQEALLVPSEDVHAVKGALVRLRSDTALRQSMAAAAHARLLRDFDFDRWVASYVSLYQGAIGAPTRAP